MTVPTSLDRRAAGLMARAAYGALFVVLLPALLVAWARRLDAWVSLPAVGATSAGVALGVAGIATMIAGTAALWRFGRGLPMSAFPPETLVRQGIYRYVAHPLYVGAVATCLGVSLAVRSPGALWIVTPVLALACVAWVLGFERDLTHGRFGALAEPVLRIPDSSTDAPSLWDRFSVYLLVLVPWLVLYLIVERLGIPAGAWELTFFVDRLIPVMPWTEAVYFVVYPMVVLGPLVARRRRDLRRFALHGLVATAVIIPLYLLLPVTFEAKPVEGTGFWQAVMRWERQGDAPVTALPAFHVVWACIAAELYAATWKWGRLAWPLAVLVCASCITTGMHGVADVIAGATMWLVVRHAGTAWRALLGVIEAWANSWKEWTFGPIRLMSHGFFAGLGVAAGMLVALPLAGPELAWWCAGATVAGGVAAALWAQVVEGSPRLKRPFGYFGGVIGVLVVVIAAALSKTDAWRLLASYLVGLSFGQGIGRLRCLVNGCCHGRAASCDVGIHYRHPSTRVVRLAGLGGAPIHPTQVYALFASVFTGLVLLRLWHVGTPLSFVVGAYFILTGLGRFVEEHLRGEPQTATLAGLRLYQWLALAFVVGGSMVTTFETVATPAAGPLDWRAVEIALALGLVGVAAFGVDVPRSNRRYARLS